MKRYFYGECLSIGVLSPRCYRDIPKPSVQASEVVEAANPIEGMKKLRECFDYYQDVTIINFKEVTTPVAEVA